MTMSDTELRSALFLGEEPKKTSEQTREEFFADIKVGVGKIQDAINPAHYKESYPFEVIDLIEKALTPEQFLGYLIGSELKYRLRAGVKTADFEQDMLKAQWYRGRRQS